MVLVALVLRSTGRNVSVRPGDTAAIPSTAVNVDDPAYFISIVPSGKNDVWTVTCRGESNTRTLHQVAVKASAAARTYTVPPDDGSRSAKKAATRGAPANRRLTSRDVIAVSRTPNVILPSELTHASVCG